MKFIALIICATISLSARALEPEANLQIDGDLMIHPDQIGQFFSAEAEQIRGTTVWDWPQLTFVKPYKTQLTQVRAQGPWDIHVDVADLKNQQFSFSLKWNDPALSVGKFEIHDTVTRDVGGIPVVVRLDGECSGMQLGIPGAGLQVSGKLRWDFSNGKLVPSWVNFSLKNNSAAVPKLDLGKCQGPPGLFQALSEALLQAATDSVWLEDLLKQAMLDWTEHELGALSEQLTARRDFSVQDPMVGAWVPEDLSALSGGLMRVSGKLILSVPGSDIGADTAVRSYNEKDLVQVTESGFLFPKDSMQKILRYFYANGLLQCRLSSSDVSAFQSLMNSRFLQFFVWPDLMSFAKTTPFYFDLSTQAVPQLGVGQMLENGGSTYPISLPFFTRQWAPGPNGSYLPYVDFSTQLSGQMTAQIANGQLQLKMQPNDFGLNYVFDREFANTRRVNPRISSSLIGSKVKDYLANKQFNFAVPSWPITPTLKLSPKDIQAWKQSFRIPLQLGH